MINIPKLLMTQNCKYFYKLELKSLINHMAIIFFF